MKRLIIMLAVFMMSCTQQKITDAEVMELLDNYFTALDVDNLESNMIDKYITDNYFIFEAEKKMPTKDFKVFISEAFKSFNTASSEWAFSDIRISTDINSAHISYINDGKFLSHDSILTEMKWLETGYMVKTNDGLKMKFMSSDNIATKITPSSK